MDPCYASWAGWLDALWRRDDRPVRTVLDVCCGTGLLAAELGRLGYRVLGTDASVAMLRQARARLGDAAVLAPAVLPHLPTDPRFDGPVDAAVSTFDGLNYLPPGDVDAAVAAIAGRLRPGGWLVFDLHTDAMMRFTLDHPVVAGVAAAPGGASSGGAEDDGGAEDGGSGVAFEIRSEVDPVARSCVSRIEMGASAAGEGFAEVHRQWFHADADVRAALAAAGLQLLAVHDEYTDTPATPETLRATWVARRDATSLP